MTVKIPLSFSFGAAGFLGVFTFASAAEDPVVYSELVTPVLEAKCVSCHGEEKQKGKLRMDSYEALLKGGSEGASLVPGDTEESLMLFRISLPLDDDEHMPPEDKEQLTKAEEALLTAWVAKGAGQSMKFSALGLGQGQLKELLAGAKSSAKGTEEKDSGPVAVVDAAVRDRVTKEVNATGASLMQVAQDTPLLRFSALNVVDRFGDSELKKLAPVALDLVWMDLARTKVTDSGLSTIAGMKNLTKLHLENTTISDAGLAHLSGLSQLEYLNLYKTSVTDAGLEKLKNLKNLKRLYLWQSKATPAGADRLRKSIPGLVVNLGWEYEAKKVAANSAAAKEAEKKPTPAKAEPKPAAKPAPKKPAPAKKEASKSTEPADELSGVRSKLRDAYAEASKLLADARKQSNSVAAKTKEAAEKLKNGNAQIAANEKAAAEAKQTEEDLAAAMGSISKALDQVRGKAGLEPIEKGLAADLAEAKKMAGQAKQRRLTAEEGLKSARALVAQAQKLKSDASKMAAGAKDRVPELQAVATAVKRALDLVER